LLNVIFFCIEINSLKLFVDTMLFIADNLLGFDVIDSAFALCFQLVSLCDMNNNDELKALVYKKMADICFKMSDFNSAITFLQKALEMCWIFDIRSLELMIYDCLGMSYFRLGYLKEAKYYHDK
jgi:hypothetical protein